MADDVWRIQLPDAAPREVAGELATALGQVDQVVEATGDTRSLAGALILVKVIGGALSDVAATLSVIRKIVETIRGAGVTGAEIELPNGAKISVDNASVDDIERLIAAASGGS